MPPFPIPASKTSQLITSMQAAEDQGVDQVVTSIECIIAASILYKFGFIDIYNLRQIIVDILVTPPEELFAALNISDSDSDHADMESDDDPLPVGTSL